MEFVRPLKGFFLRRRYDTGPFPRGKLTDSHAAQLDAFLTRFREKYVNVDLIRVGGSGDGGYLLPQTLDGLTHCFSPGVGCRATFEHELSRKYAITSFMADASVSRSPFEDPNFVFTRKYLGNRTAGEYITLGDWLRDSLDASAAGLILQMDIEGGEYDVLTFESSETLKKFSIMVIEFHALNHMFEKHFLQMLSSIFEKIYTEFSICHAHPNNYVGVAERGGFTIPPLLEVTFIRNDLIRDPRPRSTLSLPHRLDAKNVLGRPDVALPDRWWKSGSVGHSPQRPCA